MRLEPGPANWTFRETPWIGGVDAGPINDRTIGAHAVGLGGFLFDQAYHTDRDSYARLDVQEFERVGWLQSMAGYLVANADEHVGEFISHLIAARARSRMAQISGEAVLAVDEYGTAQEAAPTLHDWLGRIDHVGQRDISAMRAVAALGVEDGPGSTVADLEADMRDAVEAARATISRWARLRFGARALSLPPSKAPDARGLLVPVRRYDGPFNYHDIRRILAARIGWEKTHWLTELQESLTYPSLSMSGIPGFFLGVDGESTLLEIADAVRFEFDVNLDFNVLMRLADDLVAAQLIDLAERPAGRGARKVGS